MAKIELKIRVKYAGDVHAELLKAGWDCFTAAEFLNNIPDADVAPVRHAKVIDKIYDDHETIKQPWDYRYYCSACKIPMRDSWNKYCPNCGAKMDLEEGQWTKF